MNNLLLPIIWAAWCVVHSLLIVPSIKLKMAHLLGSRMRFYRIFYNLVAIVTAAPLVYLEYARRGPLLFAWEGGLRPVRFLMLALAVFLFASGARHYDGLRMLGLRQLKEGDRCSLAQEGCRLETGGILGVIRHPWYAGGIVLLWMREVDAAGLAVNLVLTAYLLLGAWLEERKLEAIFGQAYRRYRKQVSAFFPLKWIVRRIGGPGSSRN